MVIWIPPLEPAFIKLITYSPGSIQMNALRFFQTLVIFALIVFSVGSRAATENVTVPGVGPAFTAPAGFAVGHCDRLASDSAETEESEEEKKKKLLEEEEEEEPDCE